MAEPEDVARAAGRQPLWKGYLPLLFYHAIFLLASVVLAPLVLWRVMFDPAYRSGLGARMGFVRPRGRGDRRVVWIHGVSVGEIKASGTLIESIQLRFPGLRIIVSTTTPTGYEIASRLYGRERVIYYPIDFWWFPGKALDRIRPGCVLLMELEIWPNFLQAAARRSIPVAVINGRISERSFNGYRLVRRFLPQFHWIDRFCVQNEAYRDRLLRLGILADRISITGNMKYDSVMLEKLPADTDRLRHWLSPDGRHVLVCGSTHGKEDEWLARTARDLCRRTGTKLRLVLAPRHPERTAAVLEALTDLGMAAVRWSTCRPEHSLLGADEIVVVDTIGHLESFYRACDVAFVGGSLVAHGGQNMLEPAAMGRAVVFGPHTANFRVDVDLLIGAGAAFQVSGIDELAEVLERLLGSTDLRRDLGRHAVTLIRDNQGATERTVKLLEPILRASSERGAPEQSPGVSRTPSGQES